ncbi:GTPase [Sungkyunkwania multivorans]|uniref:GTPase n=1 Tax=Sungkyunkwania multivorans TaxID=1173618 RepID=A0ABW3D2C2_9FLAO
MTDTIEKLIFVYNARSGALNALMDAGHKLFSPSTYPCSLCALTYGAFSEKKKWKAFKRQIDTPISFLHIDEFEKEYASKFLNNYQYPVVLAATANDLQLVMSSKKLDAMEDIDQLIKELSSLLK